MNKKSIVLVVVLFVIIIAGMFIYAAMKQEELQEPPLPPADDVPQATVPYPTITRIDAKHYYLDGTHTVVGELSMPTPCDLLEAEATVMESYPEQVVLDFSVINTADSCAQMITAAPFRVDVVASASSTFSARFMGRDIELNLVPAPEGETPENFELYTK